MLGRTANWTERWKMNFGTCQSRNRALNWWVSKARPRYTWANGKGVPDRSGGKRVELGPSKNAWLVIKFSCSGPFISGPVSGWKQGVVRPIDGRAVFLILTLWHRGPYMSTLRTLIAAKEGSKLSQKCSGRWQGNAVKLDKKVLSY